MISCQINIINKLGLHARAAAKLVQLTSSFSSQIQLKRKGREVNGKSIMGVMMLAAAKGTEIEVTVDGDDEEQVMQAINELVANRFGEAE